MAKDYSVFRASIHPLKDRIQSSRAKLHLMRSPLFRLSSGKYLLCRPRGGLNDTLVQVSRCLSYAERFGRHLVIDGQKSGLLCSLSTIFSPLLKASGFSLDFSSCHLWDQLSSSDCYPQSLSGRLASYSTCRVDEGFHPHTVCEASSLEPITFDFNLSYPHPLLVHEQWGGGDTGWQALSWLQFSPCVQSIVCSFLRTIPFAYDAIHVRYSDIKQDYLSFFSALAGVLGSRPIYIATDSSEVLNYARNFFVNNLILNYLDPPSAPFGAALHDNPLVTNRETVVASLVDLMALASAESLYYPSPAAGPSSGFLTLAVSLSRRPWLRRQLLGSGAFCFLSKAFGA